MSAKPVHGHASRQGRTPTYVSWDAMLQRCYNVNCPAYKDYGGRGISVCNAWQKFEGFLRDMGERPEGTQLERLDNNKGYFPGNVEWGTVVKHARNKRRRRDNVTGLTGVSWSNAGRWISIGTRYGITTTLYKGPDFFKACCARKSWENAMNLIGA